MQTDCAATATPACQNSASNLPSAPATTARFAHVAHDMIPDKQSGFGQALPHPVGYREAPRSGVHATDATVKALARAQPWVIMAAVAFFVAGAIGVLGGAMLLVIYMLFYGRPDWNDVTPVNLVLGFAGLIYGLPLLVAGVLLTGFVRAAGRTNKLRRPEDLERAHVALLWFWRLAAIYLLVVLVSPFVIFGLAVWTGAWD